MDEWASGEQRQRQGAGNDKEKNHQNRAKRIASMDNLTTSDSERDAIMSGGVWMTSRVHRHRPVHRVSSDLLF